MQSYKQQESVIHAHGNRNCLLRNSDDGHIRQNFKEDTINMVKKTKNKEKLKRSKGKSMMTRFQQIIGDNNKELEIILKKVKKILMEIVRLENIINKLKFYYRAQQISFGKRKKFSDLKIDQQRLSNLKEKNNKLK